MALTQPLHTRIHQKFTIFYMPSNNKTSITELLLQGPYLVLLIIKL